MSPVRNDQRQPLLAKKRFEFSVAIFVNEKIDEKKSASLKSIRFGIKSSLLGCELISKGLLRPRKPPDRQDPYFTVLSSDQVEWFVNEKIIRHVIRDVDIYTISKTVVQPFSRSSPYLTRLKHGQSPAIFIDPYAIGTRKTGESCEAEGKVSWPGTFADLSHPAAQTVRIMMERLKACLAFSGIIALRGRSLRQIRCLNS